MHERSLVHICGRNERINIIHTHTRTHFSSFFFLSPERQQQETVSMLGRSSGMTFDSTPILGPLSQGHESVMTALFSNDWIHVHLLMGDNVLLYFRLSYAHRNDSDLIQGGTEKPLRASCFLYWVHGMVIILLHNCLCHLHWTPLKKTLVFLLVMLSSATETPNPAPGLPGNNLKEPLPERLWCTWHITSTLQSSQRHSQEDVRTLISR